MAGETSSTGNGVSTAAIPMQLVGPLYVKGPVLDAEISVPLATFESTLFPSVNRGARITKHAGGIVTLVTDEKMTRSILLEADSVETIFNNREEILNRQAELDAVVAESSRFAKLLTINSEIQGNLLFLRLEFDTADAAGHNMVTLASDAIMNWILSNFSELRYVSISGNYCTDKKVSAVNGILGRGKHVVCETLISDELCKKFLKTDARTLVDLHIKKNLIGSILSGSIRSANAHYANMLLAFYLACGQDAANIVEGSQGIVHAECRGTDLYFSTTIPNIIVGTVGHGKDLPFVQENFKLLGCDKDAEPGENSRRLAAIAGAVVLCGELSLLAALSNPGELMSAHKKYERS